MVRKSGSVSWSDIRFTFVDNGAVPLLSSEDVVLAVLFHGTDMISVALPSIDSVADTAMLRSTIRFDGFWNARRY